MSVTVQELEKFHRFAEEKINNGGAESLAELAGEWDAARRELEALAADIRASHADIEAGRVKPVAEAFADIRAELGLQE